jgi:transcriptional regulator with XRE-family HTH domain
MPFRQPVDVARVKQLLAQGLTQTQVHLRTGVSKNAVCLIANGKYPEPNSATRANTQGRLR